MLYELKSQELTVKIDSCGARLVSLVDREGRERMWRRDKEVWGDCAPVLFPIVGRSRNGIITVDGKDYPMPKHGLVRNAEFKTVEQDASGVTLCVCSNEKTRESYPYDYEFQVAFRLEGDCLTTTYTAKNTGTETMYYAVGGHPAFACPLEAGERFEDWRLKFERDEPLWSNQISAEESICASTKAQIPTQNGEVWLNRDLFAVDAMIFEELASKRVKLYSAKSGHGVEMDYTDYPTFAVWTLPRPEAAYVCLEPWQGMGFRDNEGTELKKRAGVLPMEPGDARSYTFSIRVF